MEIVSPDAIGFRQKHFAIRITKLIVMRVFERHRILSDIARTHTRQ